MLKLHKNNRLHKVEKNSCICVLFVFLLSCKEKPKEFDANHFISQIYSSQYVVSKIIDEETQKQVVDTFIRRFNAQKQLIIENDCVFYQYDSWGRASHVKSCLSSKCQDAMVREYTYETNKTIIKQFRNKILEMIHTQAEEEGKEAFIIQKNTYQHVLPEEVNSVFLENNVYYKNKRKNSTHFSNYLNAKEPLKIETKYEYDTLGHLVHQWRIQNEDTHKTFQTKFVYNLIGQKTDTWHSYPMDMEGYINGYLAYHKVYGYYSNGQLSQVKVFRIESTKETLITTTEYVYIEERLPNQIEKRTRR